MAKKIKKEEKKFEYPSGIPLGGIGAGKVEFCGNGKFSNVVTSNNWDVPIADGKASMGAGSSAAGIPQAFLFFNLFRHYIPPRTH